MTPTREAMARCCEDILVGAVVEDVNEILSATAAELRKTCATCQHWRLSTLSKHHTCRLIRPAVINQQHPLDGSGFCHRHKAKS